MTTLKKLPIHLLMSAANAVCKKYGFKPISSREAQGLYRSRCVPAILRTNRQDMLWIDPECIAHQHGSDPVRYLFLSKAHIVEEYSSYRDASQERKQEIRIPKEIDRQFRAALKLMRRHGIDCLFTENAAELNLEWIRNWTDPCRAEAAEDVLQKYKGVIA